MENQPIKSLSHAVYSLRLHVVLVTKFRRPAIHDEMLAYLRTACTEVLADWRCELLEFGGDADHVHLLIGIHPALEIAALINNLKSATSRRVRNRFAEHLARFFEQPVFWHRAYFVGSVGAVSAETVRRYIETQWTGQKPTPTASLDPPPGFA